MDVKCMTTILNYYILLLQIIASTIHESLHQPMHIGKLYQALPIDHWNITRVTPYLRIKKTRAATVVTQNTIYKSVKWPSHLQP